MKPRIKPDRQRNPELPLAVNETPNGAEGRPPLLPVRYPDPDLFICDVLDAIPKDDMASMGPVRLKDVDAAQTRMVAIAKDLSARGEIVLSDGKSEDELIY